MGKTFEDKFMDLQSGLISLCLEVAGQKINRVYAYCSIEEKSRMFHAFFRVGNEIKTLGQLGVDGALAIELLKLGTSDLEKIRKLCKRYHMPIPTEMKMYYNVDTGKYDAQYKYKEICSADTKVAAEDVFLAWLSEIRDETKAES